MTGIDSTGRSRQEGKWVDGVTPFFRPVALVGILAVLVGLLAVAPGAAAPADDTTMSANHTAVEGTVCVDCHQSTTPAIHEQYQQSQHAEAGVTCLDCHQAAPEDPSSAKHNGAVISVLVTPKDCGKCHDGTVSEFKHSLHDEAGLFAASAMANESGSLPESGGLNVGENNNALTHFSSASAESGCLECHGSNIQVASQENPGGPEPSVDAVTLVNYPNQGIGRLNPDGSVGSCSSCHVNHEFSVAQARKPGACSECHMGPDHPQSEIYEETKHSSVYDHREEHYNLEAENPNTSDIGAPTCAVCHMTGLGDAESTHDVSSRLYWELEPVYSWPTDKQYETGNEDYKLPDQIRERVENRYDLESGSTETVPTGAPNPFAIAEANTPEMYDQYTGEGNWWTVGDNPTRWDAFGGESAQSADAKRENMEAICSECHTTRWVKDSFGKRDEVPPLYDAVFAAAETKYYDPIAEKAPEAEPYDRSYVDQIRFEMWHHEGRRWRMGALMQGQDYEHWHGAHDVLADITELAHISAMLDGPAATDGTDETQTSTTTPSESNRDSETTEQSAETTTSSPGIGLVAGLIVILGAVLFGRKRWN